MAHHQIGSFGTHQERKEAAKGLRRGDRMKEIEEELDSWDLIPYGAPHGLGTRTD